VLGAHPRRGERVGELVTDRGGEPAERRGALGDDQRVARQLLVVDVAREREDLLDAVAVLARAARGLDPAEVAARAPEPVADARRLAEVLLGVVRGDPRQVVGVEQLVGVAADEVRGGPAEQALDVRRREQEVAVGGVDREEVARVLGEQGVGRVGGRGDDLRESARRAQTEGILERRDFSLELTQTGEIGCAAVVGQLMRSW
jgi:hypothetical protein